MYPSQSDAVMDMCETQTSSFQCKLQRWEWSFGASVSVCMARLKIVLVLAKAQKTYSRLLSVSMLTVH